MDFPAFDLTPDDARIEDPRHRPFFLPAAQTDTAALMIHGFTGSPWEMREPARELVARGISCLAMRLPGHGTTAQDLSQYRYEQWLETVCLAQQMLARNHRRVVAVGLSTGAMLALAAQGQCPFSSLVLLAPYLAFRSRLAPWAGLLRYVIRYQQRPIPPALREIYYDRRPVAGIHQLNRLRDLVAQRLPQVKVPTLVVCADGDRTVDPDSSERLYRQLGSRRKQLYRFGSDVPHVLTTTENPRLDETLRLIGDFVVAESAKSELK